MALAVWRGQKHVLCFVLRFHRKKKCRKLCHLTKEDVPIVQSLISPSCHLVLCESLWWVFFLLTDLCLFFFSRKNFILKVRPLGPNRSTREMLSFFFFVIV